MNIKNKAKEIVSQLTLEEKASLCSGRDFWHAKGLERFDIKPIMLTGWPLRLAQAGGQRRPPRHKQQCARHVLSARVHNSVKL